MKIFLLLLMFSSPIFSQVVLKVKGSKFAITKGKLKLELGKNYEFKIAGKSVHAKYYKDLKNNRAILKKFKGNVTKGDKVFLIGESQKKFRKKTWVDSGFQRWRVSIGGGASQVTWSTPDSIKNKLEDGIFPFINFGADYYLWHKVALGFNIRTGLSSELSSFSTSGIELNGNFIEVGPKVSYRFYKELKVFLNLKIIELSQEFIKNSVTKKSSLSGYGLALGFDYDFKIGKNFSLKPSIFYQMDKFSEASTEPSDYIHPESASKIGTSLSLGYLF